MVQRIDVAVVPSEALAIPADVYVVVDQLRATTTIATLFERGLRRLTAVDDIETGRTRAAEDRALLFGEVGGLTPEGFDYGNSPVEALEAPVDGREAVLFTSNGTRALCAVGSKGTVTAGALANVSAVCDAIADRERVVVVCAGTELGTRFTLEDFAAAGVFVEELLRRSASASLGDAAGLALEAVQRGEVERLVRQAEHTGNLEKLGLGEDVTFALRRDTSASVPLVTACGPGWAVLEDAARR